MTFWRLNDFSVPVVTSTNSRPFLKVAAMSNGKNRLDSDRWYISVNPSRGRIVSTANLSAFAAMMRFDFPQILSFLSRA
jgi:hypothetical protein